LNKAESKETAASRGLRWRVRLFHLWFLLRRPITFGVRAVVHDRTANSVFLIRHTYMPGWQLPGGGVEIGETALQSLARELAEEGNIEITAQPVARSVHLNRHASRRDHVVVYLVEHYRQTTPKRPDIEIAEAGFFSLDALPEATTAGTRRRLDEIFAGVEPSGEW
jgi:ADP-ribose pyrophosphatase YjhB (NUDIX family)